MSTASDVSPVELNVLESRNANRPGRKTAPATVAKNVMANLCRLGSNWLILLVIPPLLTRSMSKPAYAIWMLILQFGAYVALIQGGVETAISRFVARADYSGDWSYARRIVTAAGFCLIVASLLLCLTSLVACWQMGLLFPDMPSSLLMSAQVALLLVLLSSSLNLPGSLLSGIFQGCQQNEVIAVAVTGGRLIAAAGIAWSAVHHRSLIEMAVWIGVGACTQSLILGFAWVRDRTHSSFLPMQLQLSAVKEFLVFCGSMLVTQLSSLLITGMDLPIVAAYDFSASGYYAAATTCCNMFAVPYLAILGIFIPISAGLTATKSPAQLGDILVQITRYSTILLCLGALPLIVGMRVFLTGWIGQGYAEHMVLFATTLIAAQFVRLTMLPYAIMGFGAGQQSRMLVSPLVEGVVNLVCSLVGVRYLGAFGVALGTLVGAIVGVVLHFVNSIPNTDCVLVSRRELFWKSIVTPAAISLGMLIPALVLTAASDSRAAQVATSLTLLPALVVVHWYVTLNSKDRMFARETMSKLFDRIQAVSWAA